MAKCPSCGLPLKPQADQGRSRSLFAGFLLLALFAVGVLQAGLIIADPDAAVQPGSAFAVGSFEVAGAVLDANGTGVPNATVVLFEGAREKDPRNTTTDATGAFTFSDVEIGVYDLNATLDNRTSVVRIMIRQDETVNITLPAEGEVRTEHGSLAFIRVWLQVCGGLVLGLCLVTLLGTIACYRRRAWGLAIAGAVTGSLLWLPLSLLLGLIAVVLLVKGRPEFH